MPNNIEEIKSYFEEGFEQRLFEACVHNLSNRDNPLRINSFSYALRELIRNFISRLAPDEKVRACNWWLTDRYSSSQDQEIAIAEHRIYRTERMRYAIQGGLSNDYVRNSLGIDINDEIKQLRASIDVMNKYTHIQENTFGLGIGEQEPLIDEILEALLDFLQMIRRFREELISTLQDRIFNATIDQELYETILSLDEISTHHTTGEAYIGSQTIAEIDANYIYVVVNGSISATLQWGSNSDIRRGDGAIREESFPFTCHLKFLCESPEQYLIEADNFQVDTADWHKNWVDEDY